MGGGSYQWGPKIIQDVALNEELRGGTLVLHDINGEALQDMYEWGTRPWMRRVRSETGEDAAAGGGSPGC